MLSTVRNDIKINSYFIQIKQILACLRFEVTVSNAYGVIPRVRN